MLLVCPYCRSTLLRSAEKIENLGKMAELIEDFSPIQLNTEGRYRDTHFAVIGRIQMKYSSGVWNEWYVLFDDAKSGWLSDANGEYTMSFAEASAENIRPFSEQHPGDLVNLGGQAFTISNLEEAMCVAGDGELPFRVGAGFPAPVIDARFGNIFATIDYSDDPPMVFIGESVERESLKLTNLRENIPGAGPMEKGLRAFDCPACGAPIELSSTAIQRVGCPSCGSLLDAEDQRLKLVEKMREGMRIKPQLPLGSKGKLGGIDFEVIGFLRRETTVEGIVYRWDEYLLFDPRGEFRWLTCSEGHWNLVRVLSKPPTLSGDERAVLRSTVVGVTYEGERYRHFQHSLAKVDYVIGEFNWQVSIGETADIQDYVAPPKMLSREATDKEITWSLGEYITPEEVRTAFQLKQPPSTPLGVYANQPNPYAQTHQKTFAMFWKLAVAAFGLHLLLMLFSLGGTLSDQVLVYNANTKSHTSKPFTLTGRSSTLRVENTATFVNAWLGLDMTMVNETTGAVWESQREISYYAGSDSDGSWSEGSKDDDIVFADLPPGTYHLVIEGEPAPELSASGGTTARTRVRRSGALWSNFLLLAGLLAAFPIWTAIRRHSFETKRWMESDHPPKSSDS